MADDDEMTYYDDAPPYDDADAPPSGEAMVVRTEQQPEPTVGELAMDVIEVLVHRGVVPPVMASSRAIELRTALMAVLGRQEPQAEADLESLEDKARRIFAEPMPAPISTSIRALDDALGGGLRRTGCYTLVAPPGRGKSALMLQFAHTLSAHAPVVVFSTELDERQLLARLAAPALREPWAHVFQSGEPETVASAVQGLRVHLCTVAADPRAQLEAYRQRLGVTPLVIFDYLQHGARKLAASMERPPDARHLVARYMDALVTFAREHQTVCLVVSAVGRAGYAAADTREGSQLLGLAKESGDVEYDAAGELHLQVDLDDPEPEKPAKITVTKHRFGPTGRSVGLRADLALGVFREDVMAGLSQRELAVLEAIRGGARSANEIETEAGIKRHGSRGICRRLESLGLVTGGPPWMPA